LNVPVLLLWLNSGCNARCQTCEIWRDRSKITIGASELKNLAQDWPALGVREVELCGEPTIHPQLREICEMIRSLDIKIRFLSNGLRLGRYAPLIAEFGKSLTVSLDGPPHIHDQVRNVPKAFARLQQGLQYLRSLRPDIPVFSRCAVHRLNYLHLRETICTARSLETTDISFIGLDVTSIAFGREKLDSASLPVNTLMIPRTEVGNVAREVERLITTEAAAFASGFIRERPAVLHDILVNQLVEFWDGSDDPDRKVICNAPWTSAVLEPNGELRPCWFLPAYGNINASEGGLGGLINSEAARAYRNNIDVATNPICRKCICPRTFDSAPSSNSAVSIR
jgi:radical SAM protein with 4Fe4S-binding SPASM domain